MTSVPFYKNHDCQHNDPAKDQNMIDTYVEEMTLALSAVRKAGDEAMASFKTEIPSWEKTPNNPVCEADIAIDKMLRDILTSSRPDYGWLSEESADDLARLNCKRVWIVDPIDGTRAFLRGNSDWGVSVALVEDGAPILGLFYAPARDDLYLAQAGKGAFKNGKLLSMQPETNFERCHMIGRADAFRHKSWPVAWPEDMEVTGINSIALRLCMIADGTGDCCVTLRPKNEWDLAAADLIVREAGGTVITGTGRRLHFNKENVETGHIIAAHPDLIDDIMVRVTPALHDNDGPELKP